VVSLSHTQTHRHTQDTAVVCTTLGPWRDATAAERAALRSIDAADECKSRALSWQHRSGQRAAQRIAGEPLCTCSLRATVMAQARLGRVQREGCRAGRQWQARAVRKMIPLALHHGVDPCTCFVEAH
jgi:hypothetical protein